MYGLLKSILFRWQPERAHHLTMRLFKTALSLPGGKTLIRKMYRVEDPALKRKVFGLEFENPVGLAAGFDKDGAYYDMMPHLGFGFVEVGTVTPRPQDGNPQPRLFRLPQDKALINRMGFNNGGVDALVKNLENRDPNIIVGGNIGKNKDTPNEEAKSDYIKCFQALYPHVDYFVVNVSSPNTPGLRDLQEKEPLKDLLATLQILNVHTLNPKPILLKIAPDLNNNQLDDIVDIVKETNIAGLIATNTTIDRTNLHTDKAVVEAIGAGGLSGKPLTQRSTEVIRYLSQRVEAPIIAVGGIHSAEDAIEKLEAGASLIQIYTGMIYEGPALIKRINKALRTKQK